MCSTKWTFLFIYNVDTLRNSVDDELFILLPQFKTDFRETSVSSKLMKLNVSQSLRNSVGTWQQRGVGGTVNSVYQASVSVYTVQLTVPCREG